MTLDTIKSKIVVVLKKYHVEKASVYGSFSRNEQTENSDVDILIEPSSSFTLFEILKLERELSEALSRKIDIVEFKAIKGSIRDSVLSEAIRIL